MGPDNLNTASTGIWIWSLGAVSAVSKEHGSLVRAVIIPPEH